jgi:WD40 repeat protein/TolB-like protein
MRNCFFKIFTLILVLSSCASKPSSLVVDATSSVDGLDAAIRAASDYLNERLTKGIKLVFLNFQSEWPDLSEYVIDGLIENIVNDGVFTAVDRQTLALIQQEMNFQLSGEVSDESAQAIGKMLGAQTIVSGAISQIGNSYRLRVRAIGVETAEIQGQFNHDITASARLAALAANRRPSLSQASYPAGSGAAPSGQPNIEAGGSASIPEATQRNNGTSGSYERFTELRKLDFKFSSSIRGEIVFTPDSKAILAYDSSGNQGYIKLWDVETGSTIRTIREARSFSRMAISPDGRRFVTAASSNEGNRILLWDLATGAYRESRGHTGSVNSLAFSPDGNYFISGSSDKTIRIWSADTGQEVRTLMGHTEGYGGVLSVSYSPDGRQIVSCSSYDKTIRFWNVSNGSLILTISANCSKVAYCPDGRKIAAVEGSKIHIFDGQNGRELFVLTGHNANIQAIAFSPDGNRLLSADNRGLGSSSLIVWDMSSGWELGHMKGNGYNNSLITSADGKYFAISSYEGKIAIWGEK